jgi:tRNA A37 methylthiotransferase MiaB
MAQRAADRVGETVEVLIEESLGDGRYGGRAAHQAPEVDGTTQVRAGGRPSAGDVVRATVTGSEGADLLAEAIGSPEPDAGPARGAQRVEPA